MRIGVGPGGRGSVRATNIAPAQIIFNTTNQTQRLRAQWWMLRPQSETPGRTFTGEPGMHTNHHPGGTPTTNTNTQPHRRTEHYYSHYHNKSAASMGMYRPRCT